MKSKYVLIRLLAAWTRIPEDSVARRRRVKRGGGGVVVVVVGEEMAWAWRRRAVRSIGMNEAVNVQGRVAIT